MASKVIFILLCLLFLPFELHCLNAETWIKAGYWHSVADSLVQDINSALFTRLLCAFAYLNSSTNQLYIKSSDIQDFSTVTDTIKRKNPSIISLLSISVGKENTSIFFSTISQASYRKSFIESSIKRARLYGFHGLDLCCVSPTIGSDMTNLGSFFKEWRATVDSESRNSSYPQLILTMGAHYSPTVGSVSYPVELMQRNLDWVHIIAYDYCLPTRDNFTQAHAALYDPWSKISTDFGVKEWIGKGFPAKMLVLGLAYCEPHTGYPLKDIIHQNIFLNNSNTI